MKKILIGLCAAGLIMGTTVANATSTVKIGVVNVANLFNGAPQGKASLDSIKAKLEPQIAAIKTSQDKLKEQMKTFERNAPTMTKAKKEETAKSLATSQQAFQQQVMALQKQESTLGNAAQEKFIADSKSAIDNVAKSGQFDMILTNQAAPYSTQKFDVTDQVLAQMKKA